MGLMNLHFSWIFWQKFNFLIKWKPREDKSMHKMQCISMKIIDVGENIYFRRKRVNLFVEYMRRFLMNMNGLTS